MTKDEARIAFMAGFDVSGEGWNGEYPFAQWHGNASKRDRLAHAESELEKAFEQWWERGELRAAPRLEEP